jgi:hypothetical protein
MFRRRTRSGAAGKISTRCWEICSTTRASGRAPESPFRQPATMPNSRSRWMTMGRASIHPCALRCCSEGCGPTSRSGDQGSASRSSAISPRSTVVLSRWRPRRSVERAPDSSFHGPDQRGAGRCRRLLSAGCNETPVSIARSVPLVTHQGGKTTPDARPFRGGFVLSSHLPSLRRTAHRHRHRCVPGLGCAARRP